HLLAAGPPGTLVEAPDLPPLGRSGEHARGLRLDAVVDAWQKLERLLLAVEDARLPDRLVVPEPRMLLRQVDAAGEGGEPVPEPPPIDPLSKAASPRSAGRIFPRSSTSSSVARPPK